MAAPGSFVAPTPAEVRAIVSIADSSLRNLRITECYYRLSLVMRMRTGPGANWCTFATWASKQAGQTIRGEDFFQHLQRRAGAGWTMLHPVQSTWRFLLRRGIFNPETTLGRLVRAIHTPFDAFERASDAVARGNQKVFEEIGYEFARYVEACDPADAPDSESVLEFLSGLRAGPPAEGQDLLREAFTHYQQQTSDPSATARAQLLLLANLKIGLHEQTRLQPEILQAIEAGADTAKDLRARVQRALVPHAVLRRWFRRPIEYAAGKYIAYARSITRRAITDSLMVLTLPQSVLRLGAHLPLAFDEELAIIDSTELAELWERFEPNGAECADCGAKDWSVLAERMHYIMHLFRCVHGEAGLLDPPFSPEQVRVMRQGRIPSGAL
jgi:hypothetical protein